MEVVATIKAFGGTIYKLKHKSSVLTCAMELNVYLPPAADQKKLPVLYYLAGLTCTGNNGLEKGFFTSYAAKHEIAIVFPDTSPRGLGIAGEDESWDFGTGAGFYLDATAAPYKGHYNMESYIVKELPEFLETQFAKEIDFTRSSIFGHSMGGHGALTLFLKYPGKYQSVSAFAPISNPTKCPWGEKAFGGYLASKEEWSKHDATELIKSYEGPTPEILIDCGKGDGFYKDGQLLPENLLAASEKSKFAHKVDLRLHDGYDHSYFFISSFAGDHMAHHAKYLKSSL